MLEKSNDDLYVVYSLSMVNWLSVDNGHRIKKVEDNEHNPTLKAFFYKNTPKLHYDMEKYKNKTRR